MFPSRRWRQRRYRHRHQISRQGFATKRDAVAALNTALTELNATNHTYATLALRLGTHPVLLSERLGHTSIAVTIDLYSHVIPSIDRNAADVVAQLVLPQGS